MKGKIISVNHRLGALVAEIADNTCVVLESMGNVQAEIGDEIEGDWSTLGRTIITNITQGTQNNMVLQIADVTRNEAIARTTVV
ncbi:MAG: hypothetical protein OQK24_03360 [Magnetovibrio sp.]|nr:hypothetical protein [Magnetovibrio sp.]